MFSKFHKNIVQQKSFKYMCFTWKQTWNDTEYNVILFLLLNDISTEMNSLKNVGYVFLKDKELSAIF